MSYMKEMNGILAEKKKKGLAGIKFCVLPDSNKTAKDYELMAKAFCVLEKMKTDGVLSESQDCL